VCRAACQTRLDLGLDRWRDGDTIREQHGEQARQGIGGGKRPKDVGIAVEGVEYATALGRRNGHVWMSAHTAATNSLSAGCRFESYAAHQSFSLPNAADEGVRRIYYCQAGKKSVILRVVYL
jgi:hypothetical protein